VSDALAPSTPHVIDCDSLNRREEEFESKRYWDDFLELREEFVMNLALGTDVSATNRKLKEYEQANAASIKQNAALERGELVNRLTTAVDSTGLIKGLKELTPPPLAAEYDPFLGMSVKRDYYDVRGDYPLRRLNKAKADVSILASGFDFEQFYDESLLRAFAGLGCFIEEEKVVKEQVQSKATKSVLLNIIASDDVF
jgi:CDK-activating kinase assembly factor MAT1